MKRLFTSTLAIAALAALPLAQEARADSHMAGAMDKGAGDMMAEPTAHDHVANILLGWKYAPEKQGLLPLAIAEAETVLEHANAALNDDNPQAIKIRTRHLLHALDPSLAASNAGKGFGAWVAAETALDQVLLARQKGQGSQSIQIHSQHVEASLRNVIEWSAEISQRGRKLLNSQNPEEIRDYAHAIQSYAQYVNRGYDSDSDGTVTWVAGEGGLDQAATHMGLMVKGDPDLKDIQLELPNVDMAGR